jgi:hypothetical protein
LSVSSVIEYNAGHEQIFLASKLSSVLNARIARRFNPKQTIDLEITGVIFIGNENTVLKKNMSLLQVGDKKYFIKRFEQTRPLIVPIRSAKFANRGQSLTYILENGITSYSTKKIYL